MNTKTGKFYDRYGTYVVCVDHENGAVLYAPIIATVTNAFTSMPEVSGTLRSPFKTVSFKDIDIKDDDVISLMAEEGYFDERR